MTRLADAKKTVLTVALLGLAGCTAAIAFRYSNAPIGAPSAGAGAASAAASLPRAAPYLPASAPVWPPLPASLAGSMPPHLPLDARGHLRKTRGVRDFFDHFLTAQNELPAGAVNALVRKYIAAQLDGAPAQIEALDLWQRYTAYRQALDRLAPLGVPGSASDTGRPDGADFDAMQSSLEARASLASRTLGADWNEAFFGADWQRGRYTIERLRIMRDPALTDAQKAPRLQALDETLPTEAEARGADPHGGWRQAAVDAVAQLERQGMSSEALRAKATQALGPEAAERIVKLQQDEDAWRARYADYAVQRARIDAMGLASADRQVLVEQLRRRVFMRSGDALRAASLDRGTGD